MRLPNGFGSVSKLSGNRRKPYMVRNNIGEVLGYTENRTEGIEMLVEYNQNPYDVDVRKITLKELWAMYQETKRFSKLAKGTKTNLRAQYNKIEDLYDIPYRYVKVAHMQNAVDTSGKAGTQRIMKSFFSHLDLYAKELEITNNMYSENIMTDSYKAKKKSIFTEKEIKKLWKQSDREIVKHVLCLIYTGFRVSEYVDLRVEQVDLEKMYIQSGTKTDAGKDRIVPIHSKIQPFFIEMVTENDKYLLPETQKYEDTTKEFRNDFKKATDKTPHESRHTFRTRLYKKKIDSVIINALMGHKNANVGDEVYTHLELETLREAIEKLD